MLAVVSCGLGLGVGFALIRRLWKVGVEWTEVDVGAAADIIGGSKVSGDPGVLYTPDRDSCAKGELFVLSFPG